MPHAKLEERILSMSRSREWSQAILEWELAEASESAEPGTCLCGHHPIHDLCELANKATGARALLGNCCAKKFMGLPSDALFSSLRRLRADPAKTLAEEALSHALSKGWIAPVELALYHAASRKARPTEAMMAKKLEVNRRFELAMTGRPFEPPQRPKPDSPDWDAAFGEHEGSLGG